MSRLAQKLKVIRRLFALSGNECAFPGCTNKLITDKGNLIAQICHIEAANEGGERYNANQSDEERRSFDNLILFCYEHHIETNDVKEFPVERLRLMKADHENRFREKPYQLPVQFSNSIISQFERKLDELYSLSLDTNVKTNEILKQQTVLQEMLQTSLSRLSFDDEKIYISQLDSIKELKKKFKYRTVVELLLDFKSKNWHNLTAEVKYKVIMNLGMAYFDLHEKKNACNTFLELKEIAHETEESVSFLALAYAFLHDRANFIIYFDRGKYLNPKNVNLWLAFLYEYEDEKSLLDLIQEIPEVLMEAPEVLFNLGEIANKKGLIQEGVAYLKKAQKLLIGSDERVADTKAIIASRILIDTITPFKFIEAHFSQQEMEYIKEASLLLTEAWDMIKDTELAQTRWFVIMNRGVTNKVMGLLDNALADMEKAYEISGQYLAFKNLALLYMQMNKFRMADELVLKVSTMENLSDQQCFEIDSIKARLQILKGKTDEGVSILSKWLDEKNMERHFEVLMLILNAYFEKGLFESAQIYCDQLKISFPSNVDSYLMTGYLFFKKGDNEKALENYNIAESLVDETTPPEIIQMLANNYVEILQYEKAAVLFEKIVDSSILNNISRGLIYSYYQSGNLHGALYLSSELFSKYPQNAFLAEIIVNIYQETGDYERAAQIIEPFLKVVQEAQKDAFIQKAALFYYHLRKWDQLKTTVLSIQHPEIFSLHDSFVTAFLLVKCHEITRGLDLAYDTRTKYYNNSEAHAKYMNILHQADKEYAPFMFPDKVKEECAVYLKSETGKENVFLITKKKAIGDNVITPTDTFAILLIGKSVSDEIIMEKGFGIQHKFYITAIMDKYVYASRDSMKLFETRFASKNSITILQANPGDPNDETASFIKGISLQDQSFEKSFLELYNKRAATIGTLAGIFRQNIVKQWFNLVTAKDAFLFCYSHNEIPDIERAVQINSPIILDITYLLTNFFLFINQILSEKLQNTFIVAQSVINELMEFHDELETYKTDGRLSLAYEGGQLVSHFIEKEAIIKQSEIISNIVDWCKEKAQIKFPSQKLMLKRELRKQSAGIIGEPFHDTILLAKEYNGVVLSDDDNFKILMTSEHNIKSFSTYQLATYLFQKGLIEGASMENLSFQLVVNNHIFIPASPDLLWKVFDAAGYQIRKPFTVAVKGLFILQPLFAANSAVLFIKNVFLTINISTAREQVILFVLKELSSHLQFQDIKALMKLKIAKEFSLLQNFKDGFLSMLNNF